MSFPKPVHFPQSAGKAMAKHRFHNHDEVPTPPKAPVSKEAGEKALRWREDRKKCFPTGANIQKKVSAALVSHMSHCLGIVRAYAPNRPNLER